MMADLGFIYSATGRGIMQAAPAELRPAAAPPVQQLTLAA
jgi:hypothetical protein